MLRCKPMNSLSEDQRGDVADTILRLNSSPDACAAAVSQELLHLEMETWSEDMARHAAYLALMREEVAEGGRVKIVVATAVQRRQFGARFAAKFPPTAAAANKLLSAHVVT